jgi:hypothetical protein
LARQVSVANKLTMADPSWGPLRLIRRQSLLEDGLAPRSFATEVYPAPPV